MPGRRVGLAHGRRRRRPGRDRDPRRQLRRRDARRGGRGAARRARRGASATAAPRATHAEKNFDPAKNARRIEAIYRRIAPQRERIPVLYVHHRPQLGGAPSSLAQLIRHLDDRFEPHVFCPEGPAADLFAHAGATVHKGEVSIFAHAWDSPYEGLRWLVLGREVAALPPHLRQLERLMRDAPLPGRPPERLAAPRGRDGLAPQRREGRLAPALGARRRGPRPPLARDRRADGALGRCGDRDRPRRRGALPDPPAADDRPQLRRAARLAERRRQERARAARRTASRSASQGSSAARRAGPSSSRPPTSSCARARRRTS